MKVKFLAPVLLTGLVAFTSCSKDDNKTPTPIPPQNTAKEVKNLNASDEQKWVYFSFQTGTTVEVINPKTTDNWDIAFNRYNIRTNGGVSGIGEAEVVNTNSKDFAAVTKAPAEGYEKDKEVTEYGRPRPGQTQPSVTKSEKNPVISGTVNKQDSKGWYNYTPPKQGENTPHFEITKYVYVLKTAKGGKYVKIQLTGYTNDKNETGYITFSYDFLTEKETAKPAEKVALDFSGSEAKEVQLNATGDWKYFSLKNGEVTPATPADDLTWDIAFKGYYVKLNGGTSGKGKAEAFRTEEKDFTKVTEAPKKGFEKDKEVTFTSRDGSSSKENVSPILTGGFGSTTGAIGLNPANIAKYGSVYGPNEWVYVIKTADGTYAKIQVTDFYNQVGDKKVPGFPKLKYQLSKTVTE
ncbi:HmuY family protein [Capnocytophaga gingivalis]|uniref:HmuY family protein n=1 Tax=Capnocytophaga gingivalis TaxID=1017 RepID=UPI0023F3AF07|nr:HmuY family protein [Capnocytophaga gingivalis]